MKPTLEQVTNSLRITGMDHEEELFELIDRTDAEAKSFIDQDTFETQEALDAAGSGVLLNKSYTQAIILLVRYYFDDLGTEYGKETQEAAYCLLRQFRKCGA